MADDDEDMGTSFLKQHMSESQTSREAGSLGDKSRNPGTKGTDEYYAQRYGKSTDLSPATPVVVNREDKNSKGGDGDPGTDMFYEGKFGGDGISGGRAPKASQRNKTLKY